MAALRKGVEGVSALTALSPKEVSRFRTSFPQKSQSLYTHQFVTWANSAIRSSLLSCNIKEDRGHTAPGQRELIPSMFPQWSWTTPTLVFPLHPSLKGQEMEREAVVERARGESQTYR